MTQNNIEALIEFVPICFFFLSVYIIIGTIWYIHDSCIAPPASAFATDLPMLTVPFETFLSLYEADSAAIKLENLDKDKYAGITHAIISTDEGPVIARFTTLDLWKLLRWYKPIAKAERKRREDIACAVHAKAEQKSKQQLCE